MKIKNIFRAWGVSFLVVVGKVYGQGVIEPNAQPSPAIPMTRFDSLPKPAGVPAVLSSTPVLAALFCVVVLCLLWAGMKFKRRDIPRARNWLFAAVACVAVWGLAVLVVEYFPAR